jgi:hypothetical protein
VSVACLSCVGGSRFLGGRRTEGFKDRQDAPGMMAAVSSGPSRLRDIKDIVDADWIFIVEGSWIPASGCRVAGTCTAADTLHYRCYCR